MIVKIQRSITPAGKMLIYDKKRTVYRELPLTPEINAMLGNDLKGYFKCKMDGDGKIHISGCVTGQNW